MPRKILIISFLLLVFLFLMISILDYYDLALRLWAKHIWAISTTLLLAILAFDIGFIGFLKIKQFKKGININNIFLGVACYACSLLAAFFALIGAFGTHLLANQSEVGVIEKNGEKYIVQREDFDFGNGPYFELEYKYVNWLVRGNRCCNPEVTI